MNKVPAVLSIDPGLPDCGAALYLDGRLSRCAWCRVPLVEESLPGRAATLVSLLDTIEREMLGTGGTVDHEQLRGGVVIAEWPRIYRPERAVKGRNYDPSPLLWLSGLCAALLDRTAPYGVNFMLVQAPEWKGKMDKDAHQRFAIHNLSPDEQALVPKMPRAGRPESDALDAALLGDWMLRRQGWRR